MIVAYLLICVLLGFLLDRRWKQRRLSKLINKFNGPPTVPIFDHAFFSFFSSPRGMLKITLLLLKKYKSPFRIWLFNIPFVIIAEPEDFQIVSFKTLHKSNGYEDFQELFGQGLFTFEVSRWKLSRRIYNPVFNVKPLFNLYMKIFNEQSMMLVRKLSSIAETGKEIDLWPYFSMNSIEQFCKTAMDYNVESEEEMSKFGYLQKKGTALACKRFYQPWRNIPIISYFYKYFQGYNNFREEVQTLPLKMFQKRKSNKQHKFNSNYHNGLTENDTENTFQILVDTLITFSETNRHLSDKQLAGEITSVMFAGSETTALCLCYTLLMLAIRQDVQVKVFHELYDIFGNSDRMPDMEDIQKLNYTEQCLKETLRIFSIVPVIFRYATEDITLTNGLVIPSGTNIILAIMGIHKDPKIYPEPNIWNPDHFDPNKVANRNLCSFVPFSAGPRNCVGQKYGMIAMKATLSTILRHFKVTTSTKFEDIEYTLDLLLRSKNGYNVRLEHRHETPIS